MGHEEAGLIDEDQAILLRFLTPIVKLATGKQAVRVVSETLEAFGGAGYVEDTGIPVLLRDTQVLPIWEGTTNVLSLDVLLRTDAERGLAALRRRIQRVASGAGDGEFRKSADAACAAVEHAAHWCSTAHDRSSLQVGARRFAMTLARALGLALLVEHGGAMRDDTAAGASREACRRLRRSGIDSILDEQSA